MPKPKHPVTGAEAVAYARSDEGRAYIARCWLPKKYRDYKDNRESYRRSKAK